MVNSKVLPQVRSTGGLGLLVSGPASAASEVQSLSSSSRQISTSVI